jgi:predicted enzyme related to lactoylglutathione lyase
MLEDSNVATWIPAKDLERAKAFYADKLGLMPRQPSPSCCG